MDEDFLDQVDHLLKLEEIVAKLRHPACDEQQMNKLIEEADHIFNNFSDSAKSDWFMYLLGRVAND